MKLSDFYIGLAALFLAIENSFSYEHGWIFSFVGLIVLATYHAFREGAE